MKLFKKLFSLFIIFGMFISSLGGISPVKAEEEVTKGTLYYKIEADTKTELEKGIYYISTQNNLADENFASADFPADILSAKLEVRGAKENGLGANKYGLGFPVNVIKKDNQFDGCLTGHLFYDTANSNWRYYCDYGGAADKGPYYLYNVGTLEYTKDNIEIKANPTFAGIEGYGQIKEDNLSVNINLTIDGVNQSFNVTDFKMIDNEVNGNMNDNTVSLSVGGIIVNYTVDNVTPSVPKVGTNVNTGAPNTIVNGLANIFNTIVADNEAGFTAMDKAVVDSGGAVRIMAEITMKEVTTIESDAIEQLAKENGYNVGAYIDLSILKSVVDTAGVETKTYLRTLPNLVTFVIDLPQELQGKSNYVIHRTHNDRTDIISSTPNEFNETVILNSEGTQLTLNVCNFSTYAIGYNVIVPPVVEAPVSTVPNTGDSSNHTMMITTIALLSLGLAYVTFKSKKYLVKE